MFDRLYEKLNVDNVGTGSDPEFSMGEYRDALVVFVHIDSTDTEQTVSVNDGDSGSALGEVTLSAQGQVGYVDVKANDLSDGNDLEVDTTSQIVGVVIRGDARNIPVSQDVDASTVV